MDNTSRLGLNKPDPDPITGDPVDISKLNDNFDKIDAAINATLCTSTTRPASPFQGQIILETDTNRLYIRIGSAWAQLLLGGSGVGRTTVNVEFERPSGGDWLISGHTTGDTQKRFILDANGMMQWGSGSATPDIMLKRISAGILQLDNSLRVAGPFNGHLAAVKIGNETLPFNTTTLQDDDHLFINVEANATYILDGDIIYYAAIGADLKVGWSAPAGSSMEWCSWAPSEAHTGIPSYEGILKFESRNLSQTQGWGGTGSIIHAMPRGCLQVGGTAGQLKFRWAQQNAIADSNIVYAKSWIRLQRVA